VRFLAPAVLETAFLEIRPVRTTSPRRPALDEVVMLVALLSWIVKDTPTRGICGRRAL